MSEQKDQVLNLDGFKRLVSNIKNSLEAHTHNYAGSSTSGGSANSAVKLETARKIGDASFDGTADITLAQIGTIKMIDVTRTEFDNLISNDQIDNGVYYNVTD